MRKIAFYNNKGGVGKTTSVINVAYFMQKQGKKVTVVDCDSQQNSFDILQGTDINAVKYADFKYEKDTYYLFDLPPALNDDVRGILRECDIVFIPVSLGMFEIKGIKRVTAEINAQKTKFGGIFVTMYSKTDYETSLKFKSMLKNRLMETIIPYSVTVRESQKVGKTVEEYLDMKKVPNVKIARKIAYSYSGLTDEIIKICK